MLFLFAFILFCLYSWICLFFSFFSGNIYYLFCLELPNSNHFVRITTLVQSHQHWPQTSISALANKRRDKSDQDKQRQYFQATDDCGRTKNVKPSNELNTVVYVVIKYEV